MGDLPSQLRVILAPPEGVFMLVASDEPLPLVERRYAAEGVLPCRTDCVAGEQSSEVDQFKCVAQVREVALKAYLAFFPLVGIDAHRSMLREMRTDAAVTCSAAQV